MKRPKLTPRQLVTTKREHAAAIAPCHGHKDVFLYIFLSVGPKSAIVGRIDIPTDSLWRSN
jgi:hypothetical protein